MGDTTRKSAEQNQLEGKAKEMGGKIRGKIGDLTDNRSEQTKGKKSELNTVTLSSAPAPGTGSQWGLEKTTRAVAQNPSSMTAH